MLAHKETRGVARRYVSSPRGLFVLLSGATEIRLVGRLLYLDIVYRTHDYALHGDGHTAVGPSHQRHPFVGTAAELALDIRQYAGLGVGYLVVDFARMSRTLEEMLQHMEAMATQVWPRVEAGEE